MSEKLITYPVDGEELAIEELEEIAAEAAFADDHVLAEILRLAPYHGTAIAKAVLPYGPGPRILGGTPASYAFVQPNGATSSVRVMPFRAVIGSQSTVAMSPTDNWRLLRSAVYAPSDDGTTLGHAAVITPNASGSTRIDTVFAQVSVDVSAPTVTRLVKSPTGGTTTPTSTAPRTVQTVAIVVVPGTHTAPPAAPADNLGSNVYYIPLAHLFVPTGWTVSTSVMDPDNIQEIAPTVPQGANRPLGLVGAGPMRCVTDGPATDAFGQWAASGKPQWMMPSTMQGGIVRFFGAQPGSIQDGSTVDDSMDWRHRIFVTRIVGQASGGSPSSFAFNGAPPAGEFIPMAGSDALLAATNTAARVQDGQSFQVDDHTVLGGITTRHGASLAYVTSAELPGVLSGAQTAGLYVDMTTGALHFYCSATFLSAFPGVLFFWIFASGQMSNPSL